MITPETFEASTSNLNGNEPYDASKIHSRRPFAPKFEKQIDAAAKATEEARHRELEIEREALAFRDRSTALHFRRDILKGRLSQLQRRDITAEKARATATIAELLHSRASEQEPNRLAELKAALEVLPQLTELEKLIPSIIATAEDDLAKAETAVKELAGK